MDQQFIRVKNILLDEITNRDMSDRKIYTLVLQLFKNNEEKTNQFMTTLGGYTQGEVNQLRNQKKRNTHKIFNYITADNN